MSFERSISIKLSSFRSFFFGLVPLFVLAHFSHHLIAALLQPLLPLIRDDFALDYTQAGWVVSAYTLAYGISQLPAGWLADRLGARALLTLGISGVAVTGLVVGLSPSYIIMVIFLVLMGILGGGYHPAASPLVSASVEAKNRGRALGLHQIGGTASFFLSPLIAVGIASALGTWRASFITLSIIIIIFGIIFYVLLGHRIRNNEIQNKATVSQTETVLSSSQIRRLVVFTILGILVQVSIFSTISFVPLFAVDSLGTSEKIGAGLLALANFAGLWAGPLGGYLSDRIGKIPVMLTVSLASGPFIYLLSQSSLSWSIFLVLPIMGACQYAAMPVSEAYIISHAPTRNRSTILGIYYFASRGGPGLIMPAIGFLLDKFDFSTAFTAVGLATLVIAFACSLLLWGSRD